MGLESVQSRMSHLGASGLLYGRVREVDELLECYEQVTRQELRQLAQHLFRPSGGLSLLLWAGCAPRRSTPAGSPTDLSSQNTKHTAPVGSRVFQLVKKTRRWRGFSGIIEKRGLNMENWKKDSRKDIVMVDVDALVPPDHLLRKVERVMDYDWLYERLSPYYCADNGRPGTDPVVLIKMVLIQHLFGIASLRQTYRDIQVNVAYRWFLGYSLLEEIPHFATVSYAFCKRFPRS